MPHVFPNKSLKGRTWKTVREQSWGQTQHSLVIAVVMDPGGSNSGRSEVRVQPARREGPGLQKDQWQFFRGPLVLHL